ncbi:MAG: M6 family metalloprotease domain-containing protein [Prevotella sp.]|nr:M6 family metalloprotease domain-containing protein [Prevotella sp.]
MKQFLHTLGLLALLLGMATTAQAAPAYPGKIKKTMADGRTVEVYLRGDEHVHYYEDDRGLILQEGAAGCLSYAADQQAARRQIEQQWQTVQQARRKVAPATITRKFPTTGVVKGLVILAEYEDVKFSTPDAHATFDAMANQAHYDGPHASGSVYDYFVAQSGGRFTPQFEVVGPLTLPHNRRYYGENEKAAEMIEDACKAAKAQGTDFTQFDVNNDGTVDFVFVIFAGYGESQGGPMECIWPKMLDMTYETWTTFDGLYLGVAACTCELHGNEGAVTDGVGTFCHEFSHILGLPDVYDTSTASMTMAMGMMAWDIMDKGLYNDDTRTPAGYTAMDRYTVGWLTPTVLDQPALGVALTPLGTSNEACFIVNPDDPNEYYTIENRQLVGWDSALPGHGLIVTHVHYVPQIWAANHVNRLGNGTYEHVELIAADGLKTEATYGSDPFPGTGEATAFSPREWHTGEAVGRPLTGIREAEDGTVYFDFRADEAAAVQQPAGHLANPRACESAYDLQGRKLPGSLTAPGLRIINRNIYIIK